MVGSTKPGVLAETVVVMKKVEQSKQKRPLLSETTWDVVKTRTQNENGAIKGKRENIDKIGCRIYRQR